MTKIIECRIDNCPIEGRFPNTDTVNESGWSEISQFSITTDTGDRLRGYCPNHSSGFDGVSAE